MATATSSPLAPLSSPRPSFWEDPKFYSLSAFDRQVVAEQLDPDFASLGELERARVIREQTSPGLPRFKSSAAPPPSLPSPAPAAVDTLPRQSLTAPITPLSSPPSQIDVRPKPEGPIGRLPEPSPASGPPPSPDAARLPQQPVPPPRETVPVPPALTPGVTTSEQLARQQSNLTPEQQERFRRQRQGLGGRPPAAPSVSERLTQPLPILTEGLGPTLGPLADKALPSAIAGPVKGAAQGTGEFLEGLTSPVNVGLMAVTGGLGSLSPAASAISKAIGVGFSVDMLRQAMEVSPQLTEAVKSGDLQEAARLSAHLLGAGLFAAQGVKHGLEGTRPSPPPLRTSLPRGAEIAPVEAPAADSAAVFLAHGPTLAEQFPERFPLQSAGPESASRPSTAQEAAETFKREGALRSKVDPLPRPPRPAPPATPPLNQAARRETILPPETSTPAEVFGENWNRAVAIADNLPSFGRPTLMRQLRISAEEATRILNQMEAEGLVSKSLNKNAREVYHRVRPARPEPPRPPRPSTEPPPEIEGRIVSEPPPSPVESARGEPPVERPLEPEQAQAQARAQEQEQTGTSAEIRTEPEPLSTLSAQFEQLRARDRRVVMAPRGTELPPDIVPPGTRRATVRGVGRFFYDPSLITEREIVEAVRQNRLPEILGAREGGMGAPDKTQLSEAGGPVSAVQARAADGTEVQTAVTDARTLPETVQQAEKVTPAGGAVEIMRPEEVIEKRRVEAAKQGVEQARRRAEIETPRAPSIAESVREAGVARAEADTAGASRPVDGTETVRGEVEQAAELADRIRSMQPERALDELGKDPVREALAGALAEFKGDLKKIQRFTLEYESALSEIAEIKGQGGQGGQSAQGGRGLLPQDRMEAVEWAREAVREENIANEKMKTPEDVYPQPSESPAPAPSSAPSSPPSSQEMRSPRPVSPRRRADQTGALLPSRRPPPPAPRPAGPGEAYLMREAERLKAARTPKQSAIRDRIIKLRNAIRTGWWDSADPATRPMYEAIARGETFRPGENIDIQIDKMLHAPRVAVQIAQRGGLTRVIESVDNIDTFNQYLIARHTLRLEEIGHKTGRDVELSKAALRELDSRPAYEVPPGLPPPPSSPGQKVVAGGKEFVSVRGKDGKMAWRAPTYAEMAGAVRDYNNALLEYAVTGKHPLLPNPTGAPSMGIISRGLANTLKSLYPDYVPFQRVMEAVESGELSSGGPGVGLDRQTVYQRLTKEGSERIIIPPLESLLDRTFALTGQIERNKIAGLLTHYKTRGVAGMDKLMREMEPHEKEHGKAVIKYLDHGKLRRFETTPDIAAMSETLSRRQIEGAVKIMAIFNRIAKSGAVAYSLPFHARNLVADLASTAVIGGGKTASLKAIGAAGKEVFRRSEVLDDMEALGGAGTSYDMFRNPAETTVRQLRGERTAWESMQKVFADVERIAEKSELFGRARVYKAAYEKYIKEGHPPEDAKALAVHDSNFVLPPYHRRGKWVGPFVPVVMFLNARIQGVRSLFRAAQNDPAPLLARAGIFAAAQLAITAWNLSSPERREAYKDVADWEKEGNTVVLPAIPTKDERGRWDVLRLRMPPDMIMALQPIARAMEAWANDNPVSAKQFFAWLLEDEFNAFMPFAADPTDFLNEMTPQVIKTGVQQVANYDLFRRRAIVPTYMQDLPPEDQVFPWTSGTARLLAKPMNLPPIMVEQFLNDIFQYNAKVGLNISDNILALMGAIPPDQIGGENPFSGVGRVFSKAQGGEVEEQARAAKEALRLSAIRSFRENDARTAISLLRQGIIDGVITQSEAASIQRAAANTPEVRQSKQAERRAKEKGRQR